MRGSLPGRRAHFGPGETVVGGAEEGEVLFVGPEIVSEIGAQERSGQELAVVKANHRRFIEVADFASLRVDTLDAPNLVQTATR